MTIWLTARTAGLLALTLLTATTCLGVLAFRSGGAGQRYAAQYVHRLTASLGLGALVLHVVTIVADSYAHVGLTGAIVPFTAGYRPTWVGLGTIAGYLVLIVAALGFARGRLAGSGGWAQAWRAVHALAYAAWVLAVAHGFASGTDSGRPWARFVYLGCLVAVGASVAARVAEPVVS
jgi:sulfoxide reductase heme-binding subunit YedZ